MNIKKLTALLCAVVMVLSLTACGGSGDKAENKHYTVGICQLVQHDALDAATKGFRDAITDALGGNISGTSDLAPLDQQAAMITELFPDAKNVGIIYCSGEPNSVYQADVVKAALEKAGCTVTIYTFADTNDVVSVTGTASDANDVLYVPTDNTAASCAEAIKGAATKPIVAGEEGICKGCGVATLSIDYYELGRTTGEMAVKILKGEADISTMAIEYYPNPVKKYNPEMASLYNVTIPSDYAAIG